MLKFSNIMIAKNPVHKPRQLNLFATEAIIMLGKPEGMTQEQFAEKYCKDMNYYFGWNMTSKDAVTSGLKPVIITDKRSEVSASALVKRFKCPIYTYQQWMDGAYDEAKNQPRTKEPDYTSMFPEFLKKVAWYGFKASSNQLTDEEYEFAWTEDKTVFCEVVAKMDSKTRAFATLTVDIQFAKGMNSQTKNIDLTKYLPDNDIDGAIAEIKKLVSEIRLNAKEVPETWDEGEFRDDIYEDWDSSDWDEDYEREKAELPNGYSITSKKKSAADEKIKEAVSQMCLRRIDLENSRNGFASHYFDGRTSKEFEYSSLMRKNDIEISRDFDKVLQNGETIATIKLNYAKNKVGGTYKMLKPEIRWADGSVASLSKKADEDKELPTDTSKMVQEMASNNQYTLSDKPIMGSWILTKTISSDESLNGTIQKIEISVPADGTKTKIEVFCELDLPDDYVISYEDTIPLEDCLENGQYSSEKLYQLLESVYLDAEDDFMTDPEFEKFITGELHGESLAGEDTDW